jgi:hypothetical protein
MEVESLMLFPGKYLYILHLYLCVLFHMEPDTSKKYCVFKVRVLNPVHRATIGLIMPNGTLDIDISS